MDSTVSNWSVEKLIDACLSRPVQEDAWQEFVRRFHPTIQSSVLNVFAYVTKSENRAKQEPIENIINNLVQGVYLKLTENNGAALRDLSCNGVRSVKSYLLLISINTVRDYFCVPARGMNKRLSSAYSGIPFELCYPIAQKPVH